MTKQAFVEVWGIPTCGTVKKTLQRLASLGVECTFKDFRKTPPSRALLKAALKATAPPQKLFNTSGLSYREGGWSAKVTGMSGEQIIDALHADPMLIKRPLVRTPKGVMAGFNERALLELL